MDNGFISESNKKARRHGPTSGAHTVMFANQENQRDAFMAKRGTGISINFQRNKLAQSIDINSSQLSGIVKNLGRRVQEVENRNRRDYRTQVATIIQKLKHDSNSPTHWKQNEKIIQDFKQRNSIIVEKIHKKNRLNAFGMLEDSIDISS